MATTGNVQWQLDQSVPHPKSTTSALINVIAEGQEGIVLGYGRVTAGATLSAMTTNGTKFAPGCLILCVTSVAVATAFMMLNYGISTAPSFYSVITAGVDVGS